MTVKYKIGFTVDAETLFGMLSKFLPFEHLSVQEIVERDAQPMPKLPKGIAKPKQRRRSRSVDLQHGLNAIIMGALADGEPHPSKELEQAIAAHGGYSPNSLGSRLVALIQHGFVHQQRKGVYRLAKAEVSA